MAAKFRNTSVGRDDENVLSMYQLSDSERMVMGNNGRQLFERDFERESLLDSLERWLVQVTVKNRQRK